MSSLYYIALIPDQKLSNLCLKYKLIAKEMFQTKATLRSIAHITLIPPFKANDVTIEKIKHRVTKVAQRSEELNLTLTGWSHFKQRTIYLGCKPQPELSQLYDEFNYQVNDLIQLRQESQFIPHISIINRDLIKEQFTVAWNYFQTQNYPNQTKCSQLAIFKYSTENWQINQLFNLISQVDSHV